MSGVTRASGRMRFDAASMSARETNVTIVLRAFANWSPSLYRGMSRSAAMRQASSRQEAHVFDGTAEIPRRIELVARLVIVGGVVGFLLFPQRFRIGAEELARLADRKRGHAGLGKRKMIGAEKVAAFGMLVAADRAAALLGQRLGHRPKRGSIGTEQHDIARRVQGS